MRNLRHLVPATFLIFGLVEGACSPAFARDLTVARIFDDPNLEGPSPRALQLSPDGSRVIYLKEKTTDLKQLDLWEFDCRSGKSRLRVDSSALSAGSVENLSPEEKARRERKRISDQGIVEYVWSESGNALAFSFAGALFELPLSGDGAAAPRKLTSGKSHETDPHLSPQGKYLSFVRGSNLFLMSTESRRERPLTFDRRPTVKNGVAEFIAQEEMGRFDGQWWSPDEKRLAFTQFDEAPVEIAQRYEISGDGFTVEKQRYPRTGTRNVKMRLGVLEADPALTQRGPPYIRWLDLGSNPDIYLARVNWLPDGQTLAVQIESRDQKRLDLIFFDVRNGKRKTILTETNLRWTELNSDLRFLKKSKRFLWTSDRSGTRQIYLYGLDGTLIQPLTHHRWSIHKVLETNADESAIYLTASGDSPLEQHLFRVSLETGKEAQITREEGWHEIEMAPGARHFIDRYSNPHQPPQVSLHTEDGKLLKFLEENRLDSQHPLEPYLADFSPQEFGSFKNPEGTDLYYRLIKPRNFETGRRYPVIVYVYGGPGQQVVRKAWGGKRYLWQQLLAEQGFVVFSVDNRGSPGRDRAFEDAIYRQLGKVEVVDQKAGVDYLVKQGIADPKRVGIFGWSYGGYMTLMSLLKEPSTFQVGVSVAPVTDWSLYDTHYTEQFLGTPQENPQGYEESGVLKYVDRLQGKLLMIHGMADDNVLFTNSTKVYQAFQDRGILFDMMAYPGSKHGIYGKMRQTHLYELVTRYFQQHL